MKWKRLAKASTWVVGSVLYFALLGFAGKKSEEQRVTELNINLFQEEDQYFLKREEVSDVINNQLDSVLNMPIHLINTALLEESLDSHPLIDKSEVYFTLDGSVTVDIQQHKAIARVRTAEGDVYMNRYGAAIPRSKNHSANVPMITGHIDSIHWQEAYFFLQVLGDSDWLSNNIEGLDRDSTGLYTVYPRFGRHRIIWGAPDNNDTKVEKLEVFYAYLEQENRMDDIRTIDLRYSNQVVSTNY